MISPIRFCSAGMLWCAAVNLRYPSVFEESSAFTFKCRHLLEFFKGTFGYVIIN